MPFEGAPSVMMAASRVVALVCNVAMIDAARSEPAPSPPWHSAQRD